MTEVKVIQQVHVTSPSGVYIKQLEVQEHEWRVMKQVLNWMRDNTFGEFNAVKDNMKVRIRAGETTEIRIDS